MRLWSAVGLLICWLGILPACVHTTTSSRSASPTPFVVPITAEAPPAASFAAPIFSSTTTGSVILAGIYGDTHQCRVRKLYIEVVNPSDLAKFTRLITSHSVLDAATIDDPSGGHTVYKLRGVLATGKTMPAQYPRITLEFARIEITGCGPERSIPAPYGRP
jgi:hypothetical protein